MGMARLQSIVYAFLALSMPLSIASPPRSPTQRAEFQRLNPCPSTGDSRRSCPGYQIDHIIPLCFDGPDSTGNMQWLSVEAHKAKTRMDLKACRNESVSW